MLFNPKNPDGTRKKVTETECWIRFGIMIAPLVVPSALRVSDDWRLVIGALWLAGIGPIFCLPFASDDELDERTEWFQWVCKNIFRFYMGLLFFSFLLYLVGGGGWR